MGIPRFQRTVVPLFFLSFLLLTLANSCLAARTLTSLYQPPPLSLTYHNGALLEGNLHVSILWYGQFSPSQKSIIADFLLSLNPSAPSTSSTQPSVSYWWKLIQTYLKKAGKRETHILLSTQIYDTNCSLGKILEKSQITELATKVNSKPGGLTLVLTAEDVAVEGFCMSNCGFHGSNTKHESPFIWVGNSVTQCPGQCAWPFHQPIYGPQTTPLGAPNGDVGVDGMIINIAGSLAGTITNPFGNGYYIDSGGVPMEAASACTGMYGKGAYPGYAGELLVDSSSGASYNAVGVHGRKYLLPALFNPLTSECSPIV
ncbi:protein PHOSPHATE-INDUCED 1 [Manihot esculenta]|uniref:Uncharacterized protein n=1 Tax=Manihot esculenta TaxID=3983 RepID=A0A2C9WE34_MANES|nr:protein PHOSPHATE-INDUCED 1 [Manihot esculenta]OAY58116.1 hypothetical protein MANES_02G151300v8 [Manihot esculenta]